MNANCKLLLVAILLISRGGRERQSRGGEGRVVVRMGQEGDGKYNVTGKAILLIMVVHSPQESRSLITGLK